jgi:hypothetical protein
MTPRAWLCGCLCALACGGAPSSPIDGGAPVDGPAQLPTCPEPAELYTYTASDELVPLGPLAPLGIVIGFQGFQMARVSLRTPDPLRPEVPIISTVEVDGYPPINDRTPEIGSRPVPGGGSQSDEIDLFFNDAPLASLVGRQVRIQIRASTERCVSLSDQRATLADGVGASARDAGTPSLELGTGPAPFRPLSDGDRVTSVQGPQGLGMLILSARARGFAPGDVNAPSRADPVLATWCVNARTGEEVGSGRTQQPMAPMPDGAAAMYETQTIFLALNSAWQGQRLRCTGTLTDGAGTRATAVRELLVDPPASRSRGRAAWSLLSRRPSTAVCQPGEVALEGQGPGRPDRSLRRQIHHLRPQRAPWAPGPLVEAPDTSSVPATSAPVVPDRSLGRQIHHLRPQRAPRAAGPLVGAP